jgi:spore germination protein KC
MKLKAIMLILLLLADTILLSGCWNYREINQVAMIAGCAVDKGRRGEKYSVTIEVITFKAGGGPESGVTSELFTEDGDTMFGVIRTLILKVGKKLFWSHAKTVVISEDIAREGIVPIIDWLSRDAETRSEMWVLVSRGKTAKEVLESTETINEISSFHLDDIIRTHKSSTKILDIDILGATKELRADGVRMVLPAISMKEENKKKEAKISGIAIFKEGKLTGWLDENATKGAVWLREDADLGLIEVKNVFGTNSNIVFEVFDQKTIRKPFKEDGKLGIEIEIKPDVSIAEIQGSMDVMKKDEMEKLRQEAEEKFKKELEDVVRKAQMEHNADIFEFGLVFERKMPMEWKKVKDNWDEEFSNLEVRIKVEFEIIGSATYSKPITVGE